MHRFEEQEQGKEWLPGEPRTFVISNSDTGVRYECEFVRTDNGWFEGPFNVRVTYIPITTSPCRPTTPGRMTR